jgi:hypothetical protein
MVFVKKRKKPHMWKAREKEKLEMFHLTSDADLHE